MKTGFEVVRDVWEVLNQTVLVDSINGDIYQFTRPLNSERQDVVIGLLGVSNDLFQDATLNLKIHVPNLKVPVTGVGIDNTQPDLHNLYRIGKIVTDLIDNIWKDSFSTKVADSFLRQDPDGSWFYRIVVDYSSYNKEYSNI